MKLLIQSPKQSLNKAYLKEKISRSNIELFKKNLAVLLDKIKPNESEEHHKNLISDFLKETWYRDQYEINTKGREDLVIYSGKTSKTPVGVIMEVKKPNNKAEMISEAKPNSKALHELILYYLQERIDHNNIDIKYLIITNINEWFIIDEVWFEKFVFRNVKLKKDFENWKLSGQDTRFFYECIAAPFLDSLSETICCTSFDIRDFTKIVLNDDKTDDNKLIALYKILSPVHLLKKPFINDSNSLDKAFYSELLHIIGLTETKESGKKLIERRKEGERNHASLIESAISQLDSLDKISHLDKPYQFGATLQERLFNIGLELSITWVNRILFLKLLEAQLIKYHKGDKSYAFLNIDKVQNFDDLNSLFFSVLARNQSDRNPEVKTAFANVPYLNSSLFEPTEIEHSCFFISQLRDAKIPILSSTVLKDNSGKKRTGKLNTLEYFFEFLNAYDFSSEGSEDIQEDNKTLISASVLGLIFEKINGYKDGSFFTPSFITMYMCRETIRRAIVQKFNETKGWACTTIDQLFDNITDKKEANAIVNSLKICDIAVGSGHFLVSALNEIITVKSDLKILLDRQGKTLRDYQVEVVNDELIITDDDLKFFEYNPNNKESQRIQETLFHEKQTIIENCLFGVDINPNSVKICRLRLWIELLKNSYYKGPDFTELETLPNIDINIKCGNSLISRYALDADIRKALKRSKWSIDSYRLAVMTYRNAQSKDEKREMERLIKNIKTDFESEVAINDKRILRLNKLSGELVSLTTQTTLFEKTKTEKAAWNKQVTKLTDDIRKLETELEEVKSNKIYENAFEWRFEFPEVLNDEGEFIGFDVVIGNPPYIRQEELSNIKSYLQTNYETYAGTADLYVYFVERGMNVLRNNGAFIYILPNKWLRAGYGSKLRSWIKQFSIDSIIDFGDLPVFEEATTYPCLLAIKKTTPPTLPIFDVSIIDTLSFPNGLANYVEEKKFEVNQQQLAESGWTLVNNDIQHLLKKIKSAGIPLGAYVEGKIYRGLLTGLNEAFVIDEATKNNLIAADPKSAEVIKPFLSGREIKRFQNPKVEKHLIFIPKGFTIKRNLAPDDPNYISEAMPRYGYMDVNDAWSWFTNNYPAISNYLLPFKERAEDRTDQGDFWWELRACDYYNEFEKQKIVWPETSFDNQFTFINSSIYLNKTTFFIPSSDVAILGLLNSKLIKFYLNSIVSKMRGGYFSLSKAYVETTPIPLSLKKSDIGIIVEQIFAQNKSNPEAEISSFENRIDKLVFNLYKLSDDEIKIIESD